MCEICGAKARKLSALAGYFHEKSAEATSVYYIGRMTETAECLDQLTAYFAAGCRCGDDPEGALAIVDTAAPHLSWPRAAGDSRIPADRPRA